MTTDAGTRPPGPPQPVARLRGPGDLAAALPHLCGFVPTESLVVVALHGLRRRVGLTMRVDLPSRDNEDLLAADLVDRLAVAGADATMLVLCTEAEASGSLPRARLVRRFRAAALRGGLDVGDALLVRSGRWWSYVCDDERCCPAEGTPLDSEHSEAVGLVQAHAALEGRAVLASREDLVASLAPPAGAARDAAAAALVEAEHERAAQVCGRGRAATGRCSLTLWRQAVAWAGRPPLDLPAATAATLVVSLGDCLVRDEVLGWVLDDDAALLTLLLSLAAASPAPWDAPVCTLLAWLAHARGDGGLANVALDRALLAQPGYALALLSRQALDGQVLPAQVRELLADSRRVLRTAHPWTAA